MDRDEALKLLTGGREGIREWNNWRKSNPNELPPDLHNVDLKGCDLVTANLRRVSFLKADLSGADLTGADLHLANFQGARLNGATLSLAILDGTDLREADLSKANVSFVTHDQYTLFQGIRIETCHGDAVFKRYAQDQDYIETKIARVQVDRFLLSTRVADLKRVIDARQSMPGSLWSRRFPATLRVQRFLLLAKAKLLLRELWMWLWARTDYGRSLSRVAILAVVLALGFGVVFSSKNMLIYDPQMEQWWFTPFYYSIVTYTTLGFGDVTPKTELGQVLVTIEVILGYLTLGLLISILANKVARRS
ncbi:MAG TPA: pentapeptide repeat-containing protein [Phycisphaerae bacterium]|nr:pentapeptide repeat-containing protein [Phycisphaerae bacterium]